MKRNDQWDIANGEGEKERKGERVKGRKKEKKPTLAGGPSRNAAQARDQKNGLSERREAERVSIFPRAVAQFRPSG